MIGSVGVPPVGLGHVHRGVGAAAKLVHRESVFKTEGDADADADLNLPTTHCERLLDDLDDALSCDIRVGLIRDAPEHDGELVAAEARHRVFGADHRQEPLGNLL